MSIGDYVPSVGEQFVFLGVDAKDNFLGDWRRGRGNEGKVVRIDLVVLNETSFPFEISLVTHEDFEGDRTLAVNSSELGFLEVKPLEHWE